METNFYRDTIRALRARLLADLGLESATDVLMSKRGVEKACRETATILNRHLAASRVPKIARRKRFTYKQVLICVRYPFGDRAPHGTVA